ncbi:MAG: hypothetical protein WCY22_04840 [Acholeplasmataceae bacterium]
MNEIWKNENWWVSRYNFLEETRKTFDLPDLITFHDATLRDGEQTPGVVFTIEEKIKIASMLDEVGVQRIEAGMPAVSEDDRESIRLIKKQNLNAEIFSFVRAKEEDIAVCSDIGVDGVLIEVPIGKPKLELQFKWDIERVIDESIKAIQSARKKGLYVVYFPYDTTRADPDDIEKLISAIMTQSPPDSIGVVDTMGCALPTTIDYLVKLFREMTNLPIEIHTHNDFGLAVANTLQGVLSGASVVHCCVNGIGERTGNCALEEIAAVLQLLLGINTGINIPNLLEISQFIEDTSQCKLANNKPIVGRSNFIRESGIGADALINTPLAMFAINPAYLNSAPTLVMGKKSGLMSIKMKLAQLGLKIEDDKKAMLLEQVKMLGIKKKRYLTDEEFVQLVMKIK